jgi:two-component system cell cycle sensor histidine kinase/response regulator CckA
VRVLIIDDDLPVASICARYLDKLGHSSRISTEPFEALSFLESYPLWAEAILLDVHLPDVEGPKLAEMVWKTLPDMPIAFMTGFAVENSLEGRVVLSKPFLPQDVEEALEKLTSKEKR